MAIRRIAPCSDAVVANESVCGGNAACGYAPPNSRIPNGDGTGLAWFAAPYPFSPYRSVMQVYPRDTMVDETSRVPLVSAYYTQPVRKLRTGEGVDPLAYQSYLFQDVPRRQSRQSTLWHQ
jgi:hypothetical protein